MSELVHMLVRSLVAAHLQQVVCKMGNACQLPAIKIEQHTTFGAKEDLEVSCLEVCCCGQDAAHAGAAGHQALDQCSRQGICEAGVR